MLRRHLINSFYVFVIKGFTVVKKQIIFFDVPLDHAWKVPVLQELLNTRTNNLYVEGFDDYVMINMLCND